MGDEIRFLLNGERVDAAGVSPQTTLLEYLREQRGLTGTKEGCAEGDCGACTVVLAERDGDGVAWRPINACIRLLPSVNGKAVFTVESLAAPDGSLHPVQQALVDCHASQCGFCTPGFAMSLFGLYKSTREPPRRVVEDALSGNLCRCTGYRPIVDAAQRMYRLPPAEGWRGPGIAADGSRMLTQEDERMAAALALLEVDRALEYEHGGQRWSSPRTAGEVAAACAMRPNASIVAGMTDVALLVTKQHRMLDDVIYVGDVQDLAEISEASDSIVIGAAVSLTAAAAALNREWPELDEAWQRFASVPIRNSATLCGNVANGSPIGDSMPALIALDARVVLRGESGEREIALDAFYPGFRKTARRPGEFIAALRIPRRSPDLMLRAWKIGKRYDQDISAVFACFALECSPHARGSAASLPPAGAQFDARGGPSRLMLEAGVVRRARIGCGGVAAVPARARKTEAALESAAWNAETAQRAAATLAAEFTPIDDLRASAAYRREVLGNLLLRLFHETRGDAHIVTRVDSAVLHEASG